jgi:hypothetical protein
MWFKYYRTVLVSMMDGDFEGSRKEMRERFCKEFADGLERNSLFKHIYPEMIEVKHDYSTVNVWNDPLGERDRVLVSFHFLVDCVGICFNGFEVFVKY